MLLPLIIVFAAGVICSVICPERPIVPAKSHQENSPCTDCTSTDFIGGAKISLEKGDATTDLRSVCLSAVHGGQSPFSYAFPQAHCSSLVRLSL